MRREGRTVHAELDVLEQRLADAQQAEREAEAKLQAADSAVETARDAVREAHSLGQDPAKATRALEKSKKAAEQAALAREGMAQRVRRASSLRERFIEERGLDLLREREGRMRELTGDLVRTVNDALKANRALAAERAHHDRLLAQVPGCDPRRDGAPSEHVWEGALRALDKVVRQHPDLPAPLPRLDGLRFQEVEEQVKSQLRRERGEPAEVVGG